MANDQRKVWLKDKELAWVKAEVTDEGEGNVPRMITVERDDGEKVEVEVDPQTGEGDSVKARNLFEEDTDIRGYESVHDLTNLTHLHEAEILEALCIRFGNDQIYTYTGPILLAVNPFKELKIYTEDILGTYYSAGLLKAQQMDAPNLRPHVFAIADNAYRNLMGTSTTIVRTDQSILVSGESGAGKTETTKYVMRYLATVAKAEDADPSEKGRAERVLESNPILESFGNARTNRNDNSSRFGKFIQMSFDSKGFLVGAQIVTYLLEKVRLAKQGKGERNFHVFYQMCAGASDEDRERWFLPPITESLYTNQSEVYDRRDGVSDADQFARTDEALNKMKFTGEERNSIYSIASSVMNLGNITFDKVMVGSNDGSQVTGGHDSQSLKNVATLLEVNPDLLVTALTTKTITTGKETFMKPLDIEEAGVVRDALAKTIYSRMFDWIVKRVNIAISTDAVQSGSKSGTAKHNFIGVLDIFGFEVFEHNSFEQLCINYANETLQQQFNEFVFQLEQKLYESEKIKWAFIDFPDNKPVLDLIEAKAPKPGILALLDEQCLFPQGNDKALANKLYDLLGSGSATKPSPVKAPPGSSPANPNNKSLLNASVLPDGSADSLLFASPAERRDSKFCVRHYAGVVTYSAIGFCAKNKDELRDEVLALMRTSSRQLVLQLFPETANAQANKAGSVQSETVGSQFKGQLASLLKTIKATSPHYVRCLKPNDQNVRDTLVRPRLVDQLRYGGVLEAVKVARAGYPTRFSLRDFVRRYFMLSANMKMALSKRAQTFAADDERWIESCDMIVNGPEHLEKGAQYQIGRTKVFLRKSAFEKLETARSKIFKKNSTEIQKISRGYIKRRSYVKCMQSVRLIQRVIRGFIGRSRARTIRKNHAATKIQAVVRQFVQRSKFERQKEAAFFIQRIVRGHKGRKQAKAYRIFVKARVVQSFYRRLKARRDYIAKKRAVVVLQTNARGMLARKELKELRMQQREAGYLREKINELQKKVSELEEELRRERAANKTERLPAAQAVIKVETFPSPVMDHTPPERLIDEEPQAKRKPETPLDAMAINPDASELIALREEVARLKAAADVAVPAASIVPAAPRSEPTDDRLISELKSELDAFRSEREVSQVEMNTIKAELAVKTEALASAAAERDSLIKGADPQDLAAQAIADRDRARQELASALATVEALKRDSEEHAKRGLETHKAIPMNDNIDSDELEALKTDMAALKAAHKEEIAQLKAMSSAAVAAAVNVPMTVSNDSSPSANTEFAEKLASAAKETERLNAQLARAKDQVMRLTEERDSLSMLVSASPDAIEEMLKKVTDDRDRLQAELAKQKEAMAILASEREAMASLMKAESSENDKVRALADREAAFEKEKSKLIVELDGLALERDELKTQLAQTKMALEKQKANTSPLMTIGGSRDDSEGSAAGDDIDSQLVRSTMAELELVREVLSKENEDLKEEKTKLQHRVEELELKQGTLNTRIEELSASSQKRGFLSRASVMMSPPSVSPPTVASVMDSSKSLPTRSEMLATKCAELEAKIADMTKQKDELIEKIMVITNESNGKETTIRQFKAQVNDLNEKIEAMSQLAEQTSAIKIKLARRLDTLVQENTTLKQSLAEKEDQLAAMTDVSRVLDGELKRFQANDKEPTSGDVVI